MGGEELIGAKKLGSRMSVDLNVRNWACLYW